MKRLFLLFLVAALFTLSCGGSDDDANTADSGDTADSADTSDSGDSADTADTSDTGDSHEYGGFTWTDLSAERVGFDDAPAYCAGLGGRMPTISELRNLIQNCPETALNGPCGVTDECTDHDTCLDETCGTCKNDKGNYSVMGFSARVWSSTVEKQTDNPGTTKVWLVNFLNANIVYEDIKDPQFTICIVE